MFDNLMNDTVDLLKKSGATHLGLRASVQKNKVFIMGGDLIIEPGDIIRRRMSNSAVESYEVVEPGFHETFEDFPRHYQMDVKRLASPEAAKPPADTQADNLRHQGTREAIVSELAQYEADLAAIRDRFKEGRDAIWIAEGDAEKLLQNVQEITDLLDSVLGAGNQYSRQISAYYGHGLQNMHNSPSLQSVRDIVATVKAVQTIIKRPTTVLKQASAHLIQRSTGQSQESSVAVSLHPAINEKCRSLYTSGHYAEAVEKGFKVVRDRLRFLTDHEKGAEAFGKGKLHIGGASAPNVESDFNEAVKFLLMAIDYFRNEKAHTSDAKITDPTRAEHYLMLSSLAMHLLEDADSSKMPLQKEG